MTLTCKCGAKLEMADDQITTSARDAFYKAHDICLQPEQHFHQHMNLDNAFWSNTFAGAAMQGILANNKLLSAFVSVGETIGIEQLAAVSKGAVAQAKALLEEVKRHETANTLP